MWRLTVVGVLGLILVFFHIRYDFSGSHFDNFARIGQHKCGRSTYIQVYLIRLYWPGPYGTIIVDWGGDTVRCVVALRNKIVRFVEIVTVVVDCGDGVVLRLFVVGIDVVFDLCVIVGVVVVIAMLVVVSGGVVAGVVVVVGGGVVVVVVVVVEGGDVVVVVVVVVVVDVVVVAVQFGTSVIPSPRGGRESATNNDDKPSPFSASGPAQTKPSNTIVRRDMVIVCSHDRRQSHVTSLLASKNSDGLGAVSFKNPHSIVPILFE